MKSKKISLSLFLLIIILLNLSIVIACNHAEKNINSYFRIHVIANSDSIDDQILKLNVAKNVEEYISEITKTSENKDDYIKTISNNIYEILEISKNTILDYNKNYNVAAYIGNMRYDEKTKDDLTMEKGIYNSLKIVIGEGNGENWWSLLFPRSIDGLEVNGIMSNEEIEYSFGLANFLSNIVNRLKTN